MNMDVVTVGELNQSTHKLRLCPVIPVFAFEGVPRGHEVVHQKHLAAISFRRQLKGV